MPPLSPSAFIYAAQTYRGFYEETPGVRGGRGQMVDRFLTEMRDAPYADWSAAFVHHVGYWSHWDWQGRYSTWPLPPGNCRDLAAFAIERKATAEEPELGDVFVQFSRATKEYTRAGIILGVTHRGGLFATGEKYIECEVIEGNSTMAGGLGGPEIVQIRRKLALEQDCVVRWTRLDPRTYGRLDVAMERVADRHVVRTAVA